MIKNNNVRQKVKDANKLLYEKIADIYERIDERRSGGLLLWLRNNLTNIIPKVEGKIKLLDIGCGSGVVIRAAADLVDKKYAIDISHNMLKTVSPYASGVVCADAESIPFKAESIDLAVLFSTLHHLYDFKNVIGEIHRILKKGGILYIDHDITQTFAKRFKLILWLYRMLSRRKNKYIDAGIDGEIYDLAEFHSGGVDVDNLLEYLKQCKFEILDERYHWYGLTLLTNNIFKQKNFRKRDAPLASITVKKV